MTIDIKGTRTGAAEPASARDRFVHKTGTVFSNIPAHFILAVGALLLYLRSFMPPDAVDAAEEDYTGSIPDDAEMKPHVVLDVPEQKLHIAEEKSASAGALIDKDEESLVLLDTPSTDYHPSPVAVTENDGTLQFRPRASNDNLDLAGRGEAPAEPEGSGGAGPSPGSKGDSGGEGGSDAEEEDVPNRSSRNKASPYLGDFISGHSFVITFAALLQYAEDAGADTLAVSNLTASSGKLVPFAGGWLFTPEAGVPGFVTFTYLLKDGGVSVWQTAQARIVLHHDIVGTAGADRLIGTSHEDRVDGNDGDDNIDAREGSDIVVAGAGNDHVVSGSGNDVVYGGAGNDRIFGGLGDDIVIAGDGDDVVFGGPGNDTLYGEGGDDDLWGEGGRDIIHGGADDDNLAGGDDNDIIHGGDGNDSLSGDGGDDVLDGGAGSDINVGGMGNDIIIAAADGSDDTHDGGDGIDTLDLSGTSASVLVDLSTGRAVSVEIGADLLSSIEKVIGGSGNDRFIASADTVSLAGGAGEDEFVFTTLSIGSAEVECAIEDLEVGDRVYVEHFEITRGAAQNIENLFEDIYGQADHQYQDRDGRNIRYRNDKYEERDRTRIEADLDGDALYELSINLDGHHVLFIAENIA